MLIKPRYPKLQRQIIHNQCLGAWLFHEGAGSTINDMSGLGGVGQVTGGTVWRTGDTGPALNVNGTSSYVSVPRFNQTIPDGTGSTFMVLMRFYGGTEYAGILLSRGTNATGMMLNSDATKLGYIYHNEQWEWESGPLMVVGKWCVYAVSVFPTRAVAYVGNSAGITSATTTFTHLTTVIDGLNIGADPSIPRYLSADIAGAMLFRDALTDSEIRPFLNQDFFRSFRQPQRTRGLMELISVPGPALHVVQSGMRW